MCEVVGIAVVVAAFLFLVAKRQPSQWSADESRPALRCAECDCLTVGRWHEEEPLCFACAEKRRR